MGICIHHYPILDIKHTGILGDTDPEESWVSTCDNCWPCPSFQKVQVEAAEGPGLLGSLAHEL